LVDRVVDAPVNDFARVDGDRERWNAGMGYAALALALVGFTAGLMFRLTTLLLILGVLLLLSISSAVSFGFSFLDTALAVIGTQTVVQGCYFLGLVAKAAFTSQHVGHIL
jgi:hypothetical protein